ncbi:MAG TPA: hypothetical protein PLV01_03450 [Candidatus Kapabacteria bacterium]|nr:hypothetical protein [Candidatus Kapabacteria bacterium]
MVSIKTLLKRQSDRNDPPRIVPRQVIFAFAINVFTLIILKLI